MESINNHRSIRKYSKEPVSNELLTRLLQEAERTQTMGNMQLYSVVITRSAEMKKKLSPLHFNQPMVEEAPVVLTFCADFNRAVKWCLNREANPGYNNLLSFINAATDALLYTQTFCILAEEAGLGTCFLGTTIYQPGKIIEVLKMPKLTFPVATITLGFPDENPELSDRLPLGGVIHEETYHDYSSKDIDSIYALKESLPENREFLKINAKKTLAQIYTDIRYTKKDNEAMSETMIETLKKQGFID